MSCPLKPGEKRLVRDIALGYATLVREAMDDDFDARGPMITNELSALVLAAHIHSLERVTDADPRATLEAIVARALEIYEETSSYQPAGRA